MKKRICSVILVITVIFTVGSVHITSVNAADNIIPVDNFKAKAKHSVNQGMNWHICERVFDGQLGQDPGTSWLGRTPGQNAGDWFAIDMGDVYNIDKFIIQASDVIAKPRNAQSFSLYATTDASLYNALTGGVDEGEGSDFDPTGWTLLTANGADTPSGSVTKFAPISARYVIMVLNTTVSDLEWEIQELKINSTGMPVDGPKQAPPDVQGTPYEREIAVLYSLNIVAGQSDSSFSPEMEMTRAEFTTLMLNLLNIKPVKANINGSFIDISPEHWAFYAVETAVSMGLIDGVGGQRFEPDQPITWPQAIKMLVSLLGYDTAAERKGGYPSGYNAQATQLKLLSGLSDINDILITRGEVAKLIYNSLTVDMITAGKDETLLSIRNIQKGEGLMKGNDLTMLNNPAELPEGQVLIENQTFYTGITNIQEYLGYYVEYYVKRMQGDEFGTLIYAQPKKGRNASLRIQAEDIESVTLDEISYQLDERRNLSKAKLAPDIYLIFNGKAKPDFSERDITPDLGYLQLIDNDGDGIYNVIQTHSYVNYFVEQVGHLQMEIIDKYDQPTIRLRDDDQDFKFIVYGKDADGQFTEHDYSYIKPGMVLSIESDRMIEINGKQLIDMENATFLRIYASNETVDGKIEELSDEFGSKTVVIGGRSYRITKNVSDQNPSEINLGFQGQYVLDIWGNIAGVISKSSGNKYGILLKAGKESGLSDAVKLRMLTEDNKWETLELASRAILTSAPDAEKDDILELLNQYLNMDERTAKLIMYHINPAGEVDMISLPQPAELPAFGEVRGHNVLDEHFARESYYFWVNGSSRSFAGEIFLQGNVKYFTINVDENGDISENEEDYSVNDTNSFSHNRYYEIGCYNINDERSPTVICHYENSASRIDYDTPPYCVDRITNALDSDGNPVRKMYGYIQNRLVEEYFDDGVDISNLNCGDLICVQKKGGLITAYDEVFDSSTDWDTTPARNDGAFNSMQYITGIVAEYKNGVIAIDVSKSDPSADYDLSNVVYANSIIENRVVFLLENNKVSVTSAKFIMPGDKIFLMLYQSDFYAAIIVR